MFSTIGDAARAIAAGEVSPLEVTEFCLARIEAVDDDLNAFLHVDAEGALAAATEATKRTGPRGSLFGIPFAVKDLIDVAGMPTTAASEVFARNPAADAPVVARLRDAGAIVIGKTNLDPFAYGVFTEPTRNPWDRSLIPGGSSGGSAVAVAAGMSLGALGTDTAGSIRIPASFCGVAGLKPRNGAVPVDGIVALSPSLDSCGPLARSVEDLAVMWEAITGTTPAPVDAPRIGFAGDEVLGEMDPEIAGSYQAAIALLGEAGIELVEVELPDFSAWGRPASYVLVNEALTVHRSAGWYPDRAERYTEEVLGNLRYAEDLPAEKLAAEIRPLDGLRAAFHDALGGVSALLLPTTPLRAPSVEGISTDPKLRRKVTREVARFATAVNCCSAAAVTIPWEVVDGLPVGIDAVSRTEATALGVALRLEDLAPGVGVPPEGS
ncbi:MAG: hypothetical protein GEU71_08450 [Actinobacteria bacterium]|nr:hypothetical protein [Actinomycetota bacterium]